MPYTILVRAIRDIVLAVLVAYANKSIVKILLIACIVIDITNVVFAHLSGAVGLFNAAETWSLKIITAIAALVPELMALLLLTINNTQKQVDIEKKRVKSSNYARSM